MTRRALILVACTLFSSSVVADTFYIEAQAGLSDFSGIADGGAFPSVGIVTTPPTELPITGVPFDSTESTWAIAAGWSPRHWLAVEVGYADLGTSVRAFPASIAPITGQPISVFTNSASLDVTQWYVAARFSASLSQRFFADWLLGAGQSRFDVQGTVPIFLFPGPVAQTARYTTPDDETDLIWGFGFRWQFTDQWGLGLNYRRQDSTVIDVESATLSLRYSL